MKKVSIALVVAIAASAALAAEKVETVKKAPVKMSSAEMSKVVAGYKQNNWNSDVSSCVYGDGSVDCNPSNKFKIDWTNKTRTTP